MASWTRQTPWRQGSFLSQDGAIGLGLISPDEADKRTFVAISHDCDIANDNLDLEPTVEFLAGTFVAATNGAFTKAKNARLLHVELDSPLGKRAVSFAIRDRHHVAKGDLATYTPSDELSLASSKGVVTLRWWLAARYFRASFPDTFEDRLAQAKLDQKIDKALSPLGEAAYGIFFLVDDGSGDSCGEGDPHELRAVVVYDAEASPEEVEAVKRAAENISAAFKTRLYDSARHVWKKIELVSCDAVSDEVFSFSDLRLFKQWRLEHRSLDNDGRTLPVSAT